MSSKMSDKNEELIRQLEERLKSNSELQTRIDELSENLYEVNKKLQKAEAFKGHFISNITNEIINPFASILALSENIQSLKAENMDKARQMAALINNEAFHLDFQLKNIFAAAAIESGKEFVTCSPVNLQELLKSVIGYFKKQIDSKQIQVVFDLEDLSGEELAKSFATDGVKVEMILKNLLSNAIKFSHAGGEIKFKLSIVESGLEILVQDFGKGVPEEYRDQIYDRFKQVDERINSINSGHGLGLSIVKSYCTMLDGKLDLQFPADGGTKVFIELPVASVVDQEDDLSDFMIDIGEKF